MIDFEMTVHISYIRKCLSTVRTFEEMHARLTWMNLSQVIYQFLKSLKRFQTEVAQVRVFQATCFCHEMSGERVC